MLDKDDWKIIIDSSHKRCKEIGINFEQVIENNIINKLEFQKKLSDNNELIYLSIDYIDKFHEFINEDSCIVITDKEGYILNVFGKLKSNIAIEPSNLLNEEGIGTNAIGVCIKFKIPIQILGKQHYIKCLQNLSSYAVPIKNDNGNLIGVLGMFTGNEKCKSYILPMLNLIVNSIEEKMKLKSIECKSIVNIFNSMPVSVISADMEGNIKKFNARALELLGYDENKVRSMNIRDIFEDWDSLKRSCINSNISQEIIVKGLKKRKKCKVLIKVIYNSYENFIETVFTLLETKTSKKQVMCNALCTFDNIVGEQENFIEILQFAKRIANNKSPILIRGEEGTGKKTIAQAIHNYSFRMDEPFIMVKCAAIPEHFIDINLFGYEDEKCSGNYKLGKFELAGNGTVFLDEIVELPLNIQAQILNYIENGYICRTGNNEEVLADARIICSTTKDLEVEVSRGRLRKDLYYAINKFEICLPKLSERKKDILVLVNYFFKAAEQKSKIKVEDLSEEYIDKMISYSWPGNVTELKNLIEFIIDTKTIPENYFKKINGSNKKIGLDMETLKIDYVEKQHIIKVLKKYRGNITYSASVLGIGRNTLYSKIKKYNL